MCVCVCRGDNSLFECFHLELKQAEEIPHELVEPASWASRGHTDLFRTLTQLSHFYHVTSLLNSVAEDGKILSSVHAEAL